MAPCEGGQTPGGGAGVDETPVGAQGREPGDCACRWEKMTSNVSPRWQSLQSGREAAAPGAARGNASLPTPVTGVIYAQRYAESTVGTKPSLDLKEAICQTREHVILRGGHVCYTLVDNFYSLKKAQKVTL